MVTSVNADSVAISCWVHTEMAFGHLSDRLSEPRCTWFQSQFCPRLQRDEINAFECHFLFNNRFSSHPKGGTFAASQRATPVSWVSSCVLFPDSLKHCCAPLVDCENAVSTFEKTGTVSLAAF